MGQPTTAQLLQEGHTRHKAGNVSDAAVLYGEVLKREPGNPDALFLLGHVFWQEGRLHEAASFLGQANATRPDNLPTMDSLGTVLTQLSRLDEAEPLLRRAAELAPRSAQLLMNLGVLLLFKGQKGEAEGLLRRSLELEPDSPDGHANLATLLQSKDDLDGALEHYEASLKLRPGWGDTLMNLANLKKEMGQIGESLALYGQALTAMPNDQKVRKAHLALLTYVPGLDPEDAFIHHKAFAEWVPRPPGPPPTFANDRAPEKRLKIGYVSSDFRNHPVFRNFRPLLANHDMDAFHITLYHTTRTHDDVTEMCRDLADDWRETAGLRDDQLAELMREDGIDIALIMAGHFDSNRMALPRWRPAPICISMHDVATTGLEETDYLISDITLTPKGGKEHFSERVLHLPCLYMHEPMDEAPDVTPPPCLSQGRITFGAFNNTAKINENVLRLWGRVMAAVPDSRLLLKYRDVYTSPSVRNRIVDIMNACGVAEGRLEFQTGWDDTQAHLNGLSTADIALDTFPFCGSTTTYECLWMGVPVVTLPGDTMVSRWSATLLKSIGHTDLIAADDDDFVRRAADLAKDIERLKTLRNALRPAIAASSISDGALRARQYERLYRAVWRKWVGS